MHPTTIQVIKLLHHNTSDVINLNGHLTKSIKVESGVRQGCPLAPFLFIIAIDTFLHYLYSTPLCGTTTTINFHNHQTIALAYADDLTLFLNSPTEIPSVVSAFKTLQHVSNLQLNLNKSSLIPYSTTTTSPLHLHNIPVLQHNQSEKLLGIPITTNLTPHTTWDLVITQIQHKLASWSKLHLSIYGRINITRAYIQSRITYYAKVMPIPRLHMQQLNTIITTYVQTNQPPGKPNYRPFGKSLLHNTHKTGGLKYYPPSIYIQASQIDNVKQLFLPPYNLWKQNSIQILNSDVPIGSHILQSDPTILSHIHSKKNGVLLSQIVHNTHLSPTNHFCLTNDASTPSL